MATAPPWANGGKAPIQAPDNPQDYADFITAAARRYPGVRRWMIWGEPNRDDRFQPNRADDPVGPRSYARLLDAAYGALKAQSTANRVIGGMTWTGGTVKPADFLRKLRLANGRPPRLDRYGHNPFPYRFPKLSEPPIGPEYREISDTDTPQPGGGARHDDPSPCGCRSTRFSPTTARRRSRSSRRARRRRAT